MRTSFTLSCFSIAIVITLFVFIYYMKHMNYLRILWISLVAYMVSFVLGIAANVALGLNSVNAETPMIMWIALLVISLLITLFATIRYFQDTNIIPSVSAWIIFWSIMILFSKVVDLIVFVTAALGASAMVSIGWYYSHPMFWVSLVANIAMWWFIGYALEKDL